MRLNRLGRGFAVALAALAFAATNLAAAQASPQPSTLSSGAFYRIQIRHDDAFVEVEGGTAADGARIIQSLHQNPSYQPGHWSIVPIAGTNAVNIVNRASGKCLDVGGNPNMVGAPLVQWTCHGGANQRFVLTMTDFGWYTLSTHAAPTKVAEVPGASRANGAPLKQGNPTQGFHQQFRFNSI